MNEAVSIRGTREGLTVTLGEGDLVKVIAELSRQLETQGAFFRGGRVALETGDRPLSEEDLSSLGELLDGHEMVLRSVVAESSVTQHASQALGLRLVIPTPVPAGAAEAEQTPKEETPPKPAQKERRAPRKVRRRSPDRGAEGISSVVYRQQVRSGQRLRHPGHIVILGDVNAGAEVIAGGDIIVWGRLQGTAHAGSGGDYTAIVCALEMSPTQLRIGSLVARPEESRPVDGESGSGIVRRLLRTETRERSAQAEIALVRDEVIIVSPWTKARLPSRAK